MRGLGGVDASCHDMHGLIDARGPRETVRLCVPLLVGLKPRNIILRQTIEYFGRGV